MPESESTAHDRLVGQAEQPQTSENGKLSERPSAADQSHDIGLMASHGDPERIRNGDYSEADPFFKGRKEALAAKQAAAELIQIAPLITNPELLAKLEKKYGLLVNRVEDAMTRALQDIDVTEEETAAKERQLNEQRDAQKNAENPTPETPSPIELSQRMAEQTRRLHEFAESGNYEGIQNGMFPDLPPTFVSGRLAFAFIRAASDLSVLSNNADDSDTKDKLDFVAKQLKARAARISTSLVRDVNVESSPRDPQLDRNYP